MRLRSGATERRITHIRRHALAGTTRMETYTIDYELNGGALEAGKTNPATYTLETAAFRLEEPTRTGYTFAGWTGLAERHDPADRRRHCARLDRKSLF